MIDCPEFDAWVANTIAQLVDIDGQHSCGKQRKYLLTCAESGMASGQVPSVASFGSFLRSCKASGLVFEPCALIVPTNQMLPH